MMRKASGGAKLPHELVARVDALPLYELPRDLVDHLEALQAKIQAMQVDMKRRIDAYLARHPPDPGWTRLYDLLTEAKTDAAIKASPAALEFVELMVELVGDSVSCKTADEALLALDGVLPMGHVYATRFKVHQGRSEGPVKDLIRKMLPRLESRLQRKATTLEVWQACAQRPGRKLKFIGTGRRPTPGWHIQIKGEKDAGYARFGKSISEVRKALKAG